MKKILIIILAALFVSTSCEKMLEEDQFDKINSNVLYESEQGLNAALGGVYNLNRTYYRFKDTPETRSSYWFYCADDLGLVRTYNEANIYRDQMSPSGTYADIWKNGYQIIDRVSAIITNAAKVDMKVTEKNRIISEAKVFRAMTYLRLITIYDNILLDTIATTTKNAFDPVVYQPASKEQIFNLINADLDFAIKYLKDNVSPGIISLGLARHLRGDAAMWTKDYATAATLFDSVITCGSYELQTIDKVFGADVNHKESLFALQFDEITGGEDNLAGGSGSPLGACFNSRFYEIVLSDDASPIKKDNVYGGDCFGWTLPNDYLRSLYDKAKDKRFKAYFYPDTLIGNNPGTKYYLKPLPGDPTVKPYSTQLRQYHWSLRKYQDLVKPAGRALSYKDLILFRLAETYLFGAEAHWRLGNNTKALEYLNAIRKRAGLADATTIDLQTIMDEHARELCFEGRRWFYLKRLEKLVEQVNLYHKFGATSTTIVPFPMKEHQVRFPIPQGQIDVMGPSFPQNPGY